MKLSSALRANAAFTTSCALICLFAADFVAVRTQVPAQLWIIGLGIMLLSFVPLLLLAAARPSAWLVRTIIILDWGYVAIALIYFLLHWRQVDSIGAALILVPPAFVALFALLQQSGLTAISDEAAI